MEKERESVSEWKCKHRYLSGALCQTKEIHEHAIPSIDGVCFAKPLFRVSFMVFGKTEYSSCDFEDMEYAKSCKKTLSDYGYVAWLQVVRCQ